jgi:hypothetical protein
MMELSRNYVKQVKLCVTMTFSLSVLLVSSSNTNGILPRVSLYTKQHCEALSVQLLTYISALSSGVGFWCETKMPHPYYQLK